MLVWSLSVIIMIGLLIRVLTKVDWGVRIVLVIAFIPIILGVTSGISMFQAHLCNVKQPRDMPCLRMIAQMQESYKLKHGTYADNETLGFTIKDKYACTVIRNSPTSYNAEAVSDNDGKGINGKAGDDVWTISNDSPYPFQKINACN